MLVVLASTSPGWLSAVAEVFEATATFICDQEIVSPDPLPSGPRVVELNAIVPLLPITRAVTCPPVRSPPVPEMAVPSPIFDAGTV